MPSQVVAVIQRPHSKQHWLVFAENIPLFAKEGIILIIPNKADCTISTSAVHQIAGGNSVSGLLWQGYVQLIESPGTMHVTHTSETRQTLSRYTPHYTTLEAKIHHPSTGLCSMSRNKH